MAELAGFPLVKSCGHRAGFLCISWWFIPPLQPYPEGRLRKPNHVRCKACFLKPDRVRFLL